MRKEHSACHAIRSIQHIYNLQQKVQGLRHHPTMFYRFQMHNKMEACKIKKFPPRDRTPFFQVKNRLSNFECLESAESNRLLPLRPDPLIYIYIYMDVSV